MHADYITGYENLLSPIGSWWGVLVSTRVRWVDWKASWERYS